VCQKIGRGIDGRYYFRPDEPARTEALRRLRIGSWRNFEFQQVSYAISFYYSKGFQKITACQQAVIFWNF
jgi:hypothetical protein